MLLGQKFMGFETRAREALFGDNFMLPEKLEHAIRDGFRSLSKLVAYRLQHRPQERRPRKAGMFGAPRRWKSFGPVWISMKRWAHLAAWGAWASAHRLCA